MEDPTIPILPSFGTMSPDVISFHNYSGNNVDTDKKVQ